MELVLQFLQFFLLLMNRQANLFLRDQKLLGILVNLLFNFHYSFFQFSNIHIVDDSTRYFVICCQLNNRSLLAF